MPINISREEWIDDAFSRFLSKTSSELCFVNPLSNFTNQEISACFYIFSQYFRFSQSVSSSRNLTSRSLT